MDQAALDVGLTKLLAMRIVEATADRVRLEWDVNDSLLQPQGILHGGVHCAAVESAGSIGAALWLGDRGHAVGVSNQTDFLRSVDSGTLTAVATPIHRGRTQQLWQVDITDEDGRRVAHGKLRCQNLTPAPVGA